MKFINFTIINFSVCLTAGTLFCRYVTISKDILSALLVLAILLLFILWHRSNKRLFPDPGFGLMTFICFFLVGAINFQHRQPGANARHYVHITGNETEDYIQLRVLQQLKPGKYHHKYLAEILYIAQQPKTGKVLLEMWKDSLHVQINIDDILLIYSNIRAIPAPLNPGQFNYTAYMESKNVYGRIRLKQEDLINMVPGQTSLRGLSSRFRRKIIDHLEETSIQPEGKGMIQALLLGKKETLDPELYDDYADAGAVHILAVSGLHVGIIYLIVGFLFRPVHGFPRGRIIHSLLMVLILWGFAFLTGLSASVTRAVTMFSLFGLARILNRRTNAYNTLFLSYFLLLLINPGWIFQVGFQLSYAAVFSILWIHPRLNRLFHPSNWFLKRLWDITTVTLAAQFGVFPLTIYYFHQFPGLFFLTNLVVLPFMGLLLCTGMVIIVLAMLKALPSILADAYSIMIGWLNDFIFWVAQQDAFNFSDISYSEWLLAATYYLLISIGRLLYKIDYFRIRNALLSILILTMAMHFTTFSYKRKELIVFHKYGETLIGVRNGGNMILFRSDSVKQSKDEYPIRSYRIDNAIGKLQEEDIPNVFSFNGKNILILDSMGIYYENLATDMVVLSYNPKIHLERLMDSLQPMVIIADGSNFPWNVERWNNTCTKRKLPFHHTGSKGAFILK